MTEKTATAQVVSTAALIACMIIPMAISVMAIIEVRAVSRVTVDHTVICFTPDICAVQSNNIWYRIDGVIDMDATIPDEYVPIPDTITNNNDNNERPPI
jgi:hypothetical protein